MVDLWYFLDPPVKLMIPLLPPRRGIIAGRLPCVCCCIILNSTIIAVRMVSIYKKRLAQVNIADALETKHKFL